MKRKLVKWPMPSVRLYVLLAAVLLSACGGQETRVPDKDYGPEKPVDVSHVKDAVPRTEPRSRYGNPDSYRVNGKTYHVKESASGYREKGIASWYGLKFHGRSTSSGEPYDIYKMTAAHKTLPLPTYAQVVNLQNGKSVVVKINDRGPFHANRIIDLSYAAASKLDILAKGTGLVEVTAIDPGQYQPGAVVAEPPANPIDTVWLQVGAFGNAYNAQQLKQKLESSFELPVQIRQKNNLHKVAIGPIKTLEKLDALTVELDEMGITGTHIITE